MESLPFSQQNYNELLSVKTYVYQKLKFFQKRIFPGFKIGEGLLWLCFHISWAAVLGGLFFIAGRFKDPTYFSLKEFIIIQAYVLFIKALFILPFWWLFFILLQGLTVLKKLGVHLLCSGLYAFGVVGSIYEIKIHILHDAYPAAALFSDFYSTLLFYYSHFALFHAYNFWLEARRRMLVEQELKELAYESEIKALKAQIEPHFLFNTLNSISASVPPHLEKTRVLIAQLADTFRYALQASESNWVTLEQEVKFITTWLALEKQRLDDRLHINYRIDPNALQTIVPPMILQPLVENAIKHGISSTIEGGTVTIECKCCDKFVYIEVSDTGKGFVGSNEELYNKGVGLKNIASRLQHLYNTSLKIEQGEQGAVFSFCIPISKHVHEKSTHNR